METEQTIVTKTIERIRQVNVFRKKREGKKQGVDNIENYDYNGDSGISDYEDGEDMADKKTGERKTSKDKDAKNKIDVTAFQIDVETETQWKKLIKREGLIVVDVFTSWAGPCVGMVSILKRIKIEANDDRLWYALAQTDDINDLHMFYDQSEPTWLFIGGGKPVKVFRGCHVPHLTALIKSELAHEHLCIKGKAKRNIISIDDEVSRRKKAEAEALTLMQYMKDEEETAEGMAVVHRESSQRLMMALEPYTILVVQNYLLDTGALTEIRDELYGEFKIEQERTVKLDEKGVRELFRIPIGLPDPKQPYEEIAGLFEKPQPPKPIGEEESPEVEPPPPKPPLKIRTIPIPLPEGILGDTHIMLLENVDLKKMLAKGEKPSPTSPLQTADDYLQIKVGPVVLADARQHAPDSLHATYGKEEYLPGVWCPRRYDDKRYCMITFFPRFVTEILATPEEAASPNYMVAIFPASKMGDVKLGMEFHRDDVFATATVKLPPEVIEEMLDSWEIPKNSDAYKTKVDHLSLEVYAVSVNKKNSSLGLAIKSLDPLHTSFDKTAGKVETGKIFTKLGIDISTMPDFGETVKKFLDRGVKRPTSITQLAIAQRRNMPESEIPSATELPVKVEEDDEDLDDNNAEPQYDLDSRGGSEYEGLDEEEEHDGSFFSAPGSFSAPEGDGSFSVPPQDADGSVPAENGIMEEKPPAAEEGEEEEEEID